MGLALRGACADVRGASVCLALILGLFSNISAIIAHESCRGTEGMAPSDDMASPNSCLDENSVSLHGFHDGWKDTTSETAASVTGSCFGFGGMLVIISPMGKLSSKKSLPGIKSRHHPDLFCLFNEPSPATRRFQDFLMLSLMGSFGKLGQNSILEVRC